LFALSGIVSRFFFFDLVQYVNLRLVDDTLIIIIALLGSLCSRRLLSYDSLSLKLLSLD